MDFTNKHSQHSHIPLSPVCSCGANRGLCIGCGVCAAVCPVSCLKISFNEFGEYRPTEFPGCVKCGMCARVCPFGIDNPSETQLSNSLFGADCVSGRRIECGYYNSSFVGHSLVHNQRENGASGGLATWFLEALIENNIVDKIICAKSNDNPDKLFDFVVVDNVDDLRGCSKSSYYPLEASGVIKYVLSNEARYAVVGLPCLIKALRLAESQNSTLAQRMVFHAGLVCGLLPSKFYSEYILKLAKADPNEIKKITFREKDPTLPSSHHLVTYSKNANNPKPDGSIQHHQGPSFAWENWLFKHEACNYCDDVFAELADVVFMDAWLPEYSSKPGGDSLVITRVDKASELLKTGIEKGELNAQEISIEKVIFSQKPVLIDKRNHLAVRLRLRQIEKLPLIRKRVAPAKEENPTLMRSQMELMAIQSSSRHAWLSARNGELFEFYTKVPIFQARIRKRSRAIAKQKLRGAIKKMLKLIFKI